jgi:nucleoside-diphosphate-sugar epimerase
MPSDSVARIQPILGRVTVLRGTLAELPREAIHAWKPEGCLHLAWYAEPGKYLDADENVACLIGSLQLLDALIAGGCTRFVGAGTCFEYALTDEVLTESSPARPASLYAAAKLSLGEMGQKIAARKGCAFAWGRVFYPYGPQEDARRAIPGLINALLEGRPFNASTGEQVRDYIHVEDVAGAFAALLESRAEGVFNICSAQPVSMRELFTRLGERLGRGELIQFGKLPPRGWEPPFIRGDNSRLRTLGWAPRYPLDAGLTQTIEWWRSHRQS